jgi:hypothetical protein
MPNIEQNFMPNNSQSDTGFRCDFVQNETGLTCQFDACTSVEVKLTSILLYYHEQVTR